MEDNLINHYDIESLCDSDREELEHALYSQIHYDTGDKSIDYTNYVYSPSFISTSTPQVSLKTDEHGLLAGTLNNENCKIEKKAKGSPKHLKTDNEFILNHTAKDCKNSPKSSNEKKHVSSDLKSKTLKQKLSESTVSSNNINIKNSKQKRVKLRNDMSDEDEKRESKYKLYSLHNRTKPSHTATVIIDSDLENTGSDNSSVLTISDSDMSDSDSSSMCSKIFTKDSKLPDIQLNIDNDNSDNGNDDIDDILSVADHSSSDEDDEDEKWHVSEQDILGSQPEIFRYYKYDAVKNVRCKNCREKGHLSRDCPKPKVIVCYLCGNRNHVSTACPEPLCYNCSQPGHISSECTQSQYKWYIKCSRCDMPGHQHEYCPDNWRRFHVTTVGEPKEVKVKINPRKFCCNCGSYKHFGYKCNKPPMSSHAQITYPFIVSYKPPVIKKQKLSTKKYFHDDDQVLEPVFKKKKIQLVGFDEKTRKEKNMKIKPMKNIEMKSPDPLKNFKKIMKDYKSVEDKDNKNNKKKQKGQKLRNIREKSAFVKFAKKSNLDDKLFLYTDKHLNRKNKVNSKNKFEKQGKKKKTRKGKKVI
ncbi:hypothetical protein LOTGIDRAFT_232781 [Lottia gigantea]|uniref:Zinc finger CCHC domain-containing protein 7 n=1 Tax=Lottia gigantea TaxID=225164 RepID=V4AE42_LOTGI|nr:hypothetical protein LOTGIDRAFT_232781 [Lottia gigantea]ESO93375.1 hypothetical protein LOTGIDRAFT_232781 [Lottia gigantea]